MAGMRWITGEPQGYAGICASARWSDASAFGLDHVVVGFRTANAMVETKATAQRPLGFGGTTG